MRRNQYIAIQPDEVHIWSAYLPDNESHIGFFTSILSKDEYERANNFRFPKDQKQFTIARGILRCLLANYLGISLKNIEIVYGLWGKPCLSHESSLRFNISHSGNYALYALTLGFEVGIDLEYIDNNLELENMAMNIFSLSDLAYWRSLNHEERVNAFFKSWVCKEAFLKALGKGWLGIEKQMAFTETYNLKKRLMQNLSKNTLEYPYCFDLISEYASALFIDGPLSHPLHYNWNEKNLQETDRKHLML